MNSFDYLRTSPTRNMPWIKRGMTCEIDGKRGVVIGGKGGYVRVRYDGAKYPVVCHPHWRAVYYDDNGQVIKDYRENQ